MTGSDPLAAASRLADWLRSNDLLGYDPYDALNSPLLSRLGRSKRLRQAAMQSVRRCPFNPRPLLGIRPTANAKGLALIAAGAAKLHAATGELSWRTLADEAAARAVALQIETGDGIAWGYPFDVQVRWGFYPRGTPNVIATVFVADALLTLAELLDRPEYARTAERSAPFIDSLLVGDEEPYYAYVPGSITAVHNANVLAASLRSRLALRADRALPDRASAALAYSLERQRSDGSWPYGEGAGLEWVDGFHTAYVLGALADLDGVAPDPRLRRAIERGAAYYVESLFDSDGTPRYYPGRGLPLETHNAATAVSTLVRLSDYEQRAPALAGRVLARALELQTRAGWFVYQQRRFHEKRVPYLRWSDAHMLNALGEYVMRSAPS